MSVCMAPEVDHTARPDAIARAAAGSVDHADRARGAQRSAGAALGGVRRVAADAAHAARDRGRGREDVVGEAVRLAVDAPREDVERRAAARAAAAAAVPAARAVAALRAGE